MKLGDINDNDPVFDSTIEAHVTENSPKGTAVIPPGIRALFSILPFDMITNDLNEFRILVSPL